MISCNIIRMMNFLIECRILSCKILYTAIKFSHSEKLYIDLIKAYSRTGTCILNKKICNDKAVICFNELLNILFNIGDIDYLFSLCKGEGKKILY